MIVIYIFDMVSKTPFMVSIDFECFLVSEEQLVLAVPFILKTPTKFAADDIFFFLSLF